MEYNSWPRPTILIIHFLFVQIISFVLEMSIALDKLLPIRKTDVNIIDRDYSSMRKRFEDEMIKMEDDMNRYRNRVEQLEKEHGITVTSDHLDIISKGLIDFPFIQDGKEGKVLKLRFDLSEFQPDEILVKLTGNKLQVEGKHEEKIDERTILREYQREFIYPDNTLVDHVRAELSLDGILDVHAPLSKEIKHGPRFLGIAMK